MAIDKEKNKEEFETLLRSTKREGIDYVIEDLEKGGFLKRRHRQVITSTLKAACANTASTRARRA